MGAGSSRASAARRSLHPGGSRCRPCSAPKGYATTCVGKWHVGLTFFDQDGQPIRSGGVEAVRRVDFSRRIAAGRLTTASSASSARPAVPRPTGFTPSSKTTECPCRRPDNLTRRRCPNIPMPTTAGLASSPTNFPMEEIDLVFLKKSREFLEEPSFARLRANRSFHYHAAQAAASAVVPRAAVQKQTQAGPQWRLHP